MKRRTSLLTTGAVVLTAAIIGLTMAITGSDPADEVIAYVNGTPIHQTQVDARIDGLLTVHGDLAEAFGEDWRNRVLQSLIDDTIVDSQAKALGVEVSDEKLAEKVSDVKRLVGDEDWEEWLFTNGLTENEIERRMRLQLVATSLLAELTSDISPTDEEVRQYYDENLEDYGGASDPRPFLEVRGAVRETLTQIVQEQAYAEWLDQQRSSVDVEVVSDEWK